MAHYVIYIPGILDDIGKVQSTLFKRWARHELKPITHVMPWLGEARYQAATDDLLAVIDRLKSHHHTVSLVGASAGASAALNTLFSRPHAISSVVLICPKINNSDNIGSKIATKNPTFVESMHILDSQINQLSNVQKQLITIYISPRDGIIPYADSHVTGIKEIKLPGLRHNAAILFALAFRSKTISRQLKATVAPA